MAKKQWNIQIIVGQRVRAYQREGWQHRHTYIEGTLVGYKNRGELLFFRIAVDRRIYRGQLAPIPKPFMEVIANGTPLLEGGVSNRVEPVNHYEAWLAWYESRMKNTIMVGDREVPWSQARMDAEKWKWTEDGYILEDEPTGEQN